MSKENHGSFISTNVNGKVFSDNPPKADYIRSKLPEGQYHSALAEYHCVTEKDDCLSNRLFLACGCNSDAFDLLFSLAVSIEEVIS